jgi:hypothetical protein
MSLEFDHGGHTYRVGKLPAMRQFHVVRRLAPMLPNMAGLGLKPGASRPEDMIAVLEPLARAVAGMSDADAEYVIATCMSAVERKQPAGGWARMESGGRLMFEDMDMVGMVFIVGQVLRHNLSGFFDALPQGFAGASRT